MLATQTPLVFVTRKSFCEEGPLRRLLCDHGAALEMPTSCFVGGEWAPFVARAACMRPVFGGRCDGAAEAARLICDHARANRMVP